MPTINVVINNQKVCAAGDLDTSFLSASLVSATQGPMVLGIHELRSDKYGEDRLISWHDGIVQIGDEITLKLEQSDHVGPPSPQKIQFKPKIQTRKSVSWIVSVNGLERLRASLNGFDQIQAQLIWRRGEECLVKIGSVNWDNDKSQQWLEEMLRVGNEISFVIAE